MPGRVDEPGPMCQNGLRAGGRSGKFWGWPNPERAAGFEAVRGATYRPLPVREEFSSGELEGTGLICDKSRRNSLPMPGTGRKPYETIDAVVPFGRGRLQPPDRLSDDARRHFADLIGSVASGHFKPADLPLICRWAETAALAERAALAMEHPNNVVTPDGKMSPWVTIHQQCVKTLSGLALRLRLGPQSRMRTQSKKTVETMSYYDEMRQRPGWDKL
jgi:hypothetical protein